jgi:hypothetical protein
MHPVLAQELVAQHIAELHLLRELRARPGRAGRRRRTVWGRLPFRRPRPATA